MRRLNGRAALVTGGGSGIGRATALRLAAEGASVAVSGRRAELLEETVAAVEREGGTAVALPGDVTIEEEARRMVEQTRARFGKLDVLVNNAGAIRRGLRLHEVPTERWDEQIAVNLRGVFLVTRAALAVMLEGRGDRSLINIASTFAHTNAVGVGPYAAAKGGVVALTRSLAVEYAEQGIRANCVCPAIVDTPLARVDRSDFDERRETYAGMFPLGRVGEPEDVAAAVAYLASGEAGWVTGVVVDIDGGFTAR
ncbi:MAG: SDR family NAD(P)-dependent oxidoreductase [Gaiellaceae bacterium]